MHLEYYLQDEKHHTATIFQNQAFWDQQYFQKLQKPFLNMLRM